MMINLNQDVIKWYKENIGIKEEYKGDINVINWEDEMSDIDNIGEELESDEDEYEVNSDMKSESEQEEEDE